MSVKIQIKGTKETSEYSDALAIKTIFESEFDSKDINGEILIINNATLFGQETKDIDLIVIGSFDKYSKRVITQAKSGIDKSIIEDEERNLFVNDFCFVIETKSHRAEDIELNGVNLLVSYDDRKSDVTTQSEKQKYSLKNFFKDRLDFEPYICNFIWFRNVSWNSITEMLGPNNVTHFKHNYLPSIFNLNLLFRLACVQSIPYNPADKASKKLKNYCVFSSLVYNANYNFSDIRKIFELFTKVQSAVGELTRSKIEKITGKILHEQKYAKAIGEKLVVISGRAGTGKTIKLLTIACDLAIDKGERSLILTYNHALVSDIKRMLALAEIPDGIDDYTVNISTLHKFFYELLLGFEIGTVVSSNGKTYIDNYIERYLDLLNELKEHMDIKLIGSKEITELMLSRHDQVCWNYILIDEAQDWKEIEKELVFRIFGMQRVVIADGIDQLIRSQKKCNWTKSLTPERDFRKTNEKKGLRQKTNLVTFVNAAANKLGINWKLEPKKELIGGKVIISTNGYKINIHQREFNKCINKGNSAYEMMFLVPPSLVKREKAYNDFGDEIVSRSFLYMDRYREAGIPIWDGTCSNLRTEYVVNLDEHRLLQYESCRGLEGWTVVCLDFDEFIRYKHDTFKEEVQGELALETFEEKRNRFVYLWALIPLTRAIDTLIITIKDKNSFIGKQLKSIHEENSDFIEWID